MTYGDDLNLSEDDDEFDPDDEFYSEDEDEEHIYDDEYEDTGADRWEPSNAGDS